MTTDERITKLSTLLASIPEMSPVLVEKMLRELGLPQLFERADRLELEVKSAIEGPRDWKEEKRQNIELIADGTRTAFFRMDRNLKTWLPELVPGKGEHSSDGTAKRMTLDCQSMSPEAALLLCGEYPREVPKNE